MQRTRAINIFCNHEQVWFLPQSLSESTSIFLTLTISFFGGMVANFDINVFIVRRPVDLLQRRPCTVRWYDGHRPMPGRANTDLLRYFFKFLHLTDLVR